MKFSKEQIDFIHKIGLKIDFEKELSDDDYIDIEEQVGLKLQISGFDKNDNVTEIGKMCESILDKLND